MEIISDATIQHWRVVRSRAGDRRAKSKGHTAVVEDHIT